MATPERMERFRRDIADLKLRTGRERRERIAQGIGAAMMIVGVVVGLVTYQASLNQDDVRDVQSSTILAVVMLAVAVVGAALFLTFTLTRFLRLWLLRQLYEGEAHVDEAVERVASDGSRQVLVLDVDTGRAERRVDGGPGSAR